MTVLPPSREQMVAFFEAHLPVWAANASAIGLDAAQVTDLATRTDAARTALDEQTAAINAKLAATGVMHDRTDDLRGLGADLIKVIKTHAEVTGDPDVYTTAQIPPPAPPTPVGKPPAPTEVVSIINSYGYGVISWKGNRTGGTYYILERRLTALDGNEGPWTYAGSSASNDYTDTTIPIGQKAVLYRVFARRPAGDSPAVQSNTLYFGIAGIAGSGEGSQSLTIAA